jgi:hypothetical protein
MSIAVPHVDEDEAEAESRALGVAIAVSDADSRSVSHERVRAWLLEIAGGAFDAPVPEPD